MSAPTFDILNGPDGAVKPVNVLDEERRHGGKGIAVFVLVTLIGIAGAAWLYTVNHAYLGMSIVMVIAVALIGAVLGKIANNKSQQKRTWLESEIELSWFRSLNAMKDDETSNMDWDLWEQGAATPDAQTRIGEYERGFRDGYARGLRDAG